MCTSWNEGRQVLLLVAVICIASGITQILIIVTITLLLLLCKWYNDLEIKCYAYVRNEFFFAIRDKITITECLGLFPFTIQNVKSMHSHECSVFICMYLSVCNRYTLCVKYYMVIGWQKLWGQRFGRWPRWREPPQAMKVEGIDACIHLVLQPAWPQPRLDCCNPSKMNYKDGVWFCLSWVCFLFSLLMLRCQFVSQCSRRPVHII